MNAKLPKTGTRRTLARWAPLFAAAFLLQAQGCVFDWETALEQGLISLSNGVASSFVTLLLRDLLPGNINPAHLQQQQHQQPPHAGT